MARIDQSTNSIGSTRLQRIEPLTPEQYAVFQNIETMTTYLVDNGVLTRRQADVMSKNDLANAIRIEIDKGNFVNPEPPVEEGEGLDGMGGDMRTFGFGVDESIEGKDAFNEEGENPKETPEGFDTSEEELDI